MSVRLVFVKYTSDGTKAVRDIKDFKDFHPKHSSDFVKGHKYEVLHELENGTQDYFSATIYCLASSSHDLITKEKAQKAWKLPSSYLTKFASGQVSRKTAKVTTVEVRAVSKERKAKAGKNLSAAEKRMQQYLDKACSDSSTLLNPDGPHSTSTQTKRPKTKQIKGRKPSEQEKEGSDGEMSSSEELVSNAELKEKEMEIARLKQSLKVSTERRERAERDRKEMEEKLELVKEAKAMGNHEPDAKDQHDDLSLSVEKDEKSEKDVLDASPATSASPETSKTLSVKRNLYPEDASESPEGPKKSKKTKKDDVEDLNLQTRVGTRIYEDLVNKHKLKVVDNKVKLGKGVLIDSTAWESIRTSKNENKYIGALMRAVWGRRTLGLKTMKGGSPKNVKSRPTQEKKKAPMTPLKLNVLLGGLRGYYQYVGVPEKLMEDTVMKGKRIVGAKLNNKAKWLRNQNQEKKETKEKGGSPKADDLADETASISPK